MITENGKLVVLEDFSIDRDLPKYRKKIRGKGITSKEGTLDLTESDGEDEMESDDIRVSRNVIYKTSFPKSKPIEPNSVLASNFFAC